jgi:hypothetical protein
MENITKKEFSEALCDLRKAHRLIFSYQEKMLDLIHFIGQKYGFTDIQGNKYFSEPIKKKKSGSLELLKGMWAWDFLYSYVFQYNLGDLPLDDDSACAMSIIQYSDTGFYDSANELNKVDVNSFEHVEEAASKLLFIFEYKPKKVKDWIWNEGDIVDDKSYASKLHTRSVVKHKLGNIQLMYSFSMESFLNEKTTMKALKEFADFCKKETDVELL